MYQLKVNQKEGIQIYFVASNRKIVRDKEGKKITYCLREYRQAMAFLEKLNEGGR